MGYYLAVDTDGVTSYLLVLVLAAVGRCLTNDYQHADLIDAAPKDSGDHLSLSSKSQEMELINDRRMKRNKLCYTNPSLHSNAGTQTRALQRSIVPYFREPLLYVDINHASWQESKPSNHTRLVNHQHAIHSCIVNPPPTPPSSAHQHTVRPSSSWHPVPSSLAAHPANHQYC